MRNPLIRDLSVIAACIALCAGLAFAFSSTRTTVAPARAQLVLTEVRTPNLESSSTLTGRNRVADEVLRAQSRSVFVAAAETLGIGLDQLRRTVSVRQSDDATAIVIDGKATMLEQSEARANAVAAAYEAAVRSDYDADVASVIGALTNLNDTEGERADDLASQLATIDAQLQQDAAANAESAAAQASLLRNLINNDPARAELQSELNDVRRSIRDRSSRIETLNAEAELFDAGLAFTNLADGASGPVEPRTARNIALAAAAGFLIGLGVVWSYSEAMSAGSSDRRR